MVFVACLEAVTLLALVAIVYLFIRRQDQTENAHARAYIAWADERRELLNRVQAPERIPLAAADNFVIPEPEPDELALVGQILESAEE